MSYYSNVAANQVYVGTYSKYNDGNLAGAWLSLDKHNTEKEFYSAARALHKNEADPELMFQDYEGTFPKEFYGESYFDERLWDWLLLSDDEKDTIAAWMDCNGGTDSIEYILDCCVGTAGSWEEYVDEYIDSTGMLEGVPDYLVRYFDLEAFGNDLRHDYSVGETLSGVYVFANH
jgi:antirestriction protein